MSRTKALAILGTAALAGLIYWTVSTIPNPPPPVKEEDRPLIMSYEGNTLSEEKDGKKIWDLKADSIEMDLETQDMMVKNILAHFYAKDGRIVEARAKEGRFNNETKDISLTGEVIVSTSDGAKLTSKELTWTAAKELLSAIGDAHAAKDDMRAEGDRMDSYDGFNKIKITGRAHLVKGVMENEAE